MGQEFSRDLEAVQQPVGVGGIAARLDCLSQTNRVTPGGDRLFEQMLEVRAEAPGRTRSAMRASTRRSASTSASAQIRSIVVVAGRWFACDGRPRRTCSPGSRSTAPVALLRGAGPRAHAPHRPRRTGIRTGGAVRRDARAGSRTAPRSRRGWPTATRRCPNCAANSVSTRSLLGWAVGVVSPTINYRSGSLFKFPDRSTLASRSEPPGG